MNGKDLIILLGSTAIAASKSCEINTQADTEELASLGSSDANNSWRRLKATQKSWSVTVNTLVSSASSAATELLRVGTTYNLKMRDSSSSTNRLSGNAICTRCKVTATVGNLVTGSFVFEGNGPLS